MRKTYLSTAAILVSLMLIGAGCAPANEERPEAAQPTATSGTEQVTVDTSAATPTYKGDDGERASEKDSEKEDSDDAATAPAPTPVKPAPKQPAAGAATYSLADIAKHKDQSSCWTAINGGVYDLTDWISKHPGGERGILSICGIDGSSAFNNQHGGQGRPEQILASYKIGALK